MVETLNDKSKTDDDSIKHFNHDSQNTFQDFYTNF